MSLKGFTFNPLSPYSNPTSDYKESVSKVVDLSVMTPLKKGDLVIWSGNGESCLKATGEIAQGVLVAGERDYKLKEWSGGSYVKIMQRGKTLIPLSDLPEGIQRGDDLTIKAGIWAKASAGERVYASVGEKTEGGFVTDLFFLG